MYSPDRGDGGGSFRENGSLPSAPGKKIGEACLDCDLCRKECGFLRKYGTPGDLARAYDSLSQSRQAISFECSLCQLCTAVCPRKLDPSGLFLEMRRVRRRRTGKDDPEHGRAQAYEKRGISRRFTYYALPSGCDTVFFPGCALPGSRPEKTFRLYEQMKKDIPSLGVVLDCCLKISHDLGREEFFHARFREMKEYLLQNGVRHILVACPNCYRMFRDYGKEFTVRTVYELLSARFGPPGKRTKGTVAIHDPCVLRFEPAVHAAVRNLVERQGVTVEELPHHRRNTLCCGEGGLVGRLSPDLAQQWGEIRKSEAQGRRLITYCAGCAHLLGRITPASHILDLLFEPEATLAGKAKVSSPPVTYLHRLRLKRRFKKAISAPVTRERDFRDARESPQKNRGKRLALLGGILTVILAVRFAGANASLDQEALKSWIHGYGILGPTVYMLIYAAAPALLLPGLPITIAGGMLFGPFWGVVYTIISSTLGACFAFLIARHVARGWIEAKLESPRWSRLDRGVEEHGWKVVLLTRLIPLFPFNLLNYALGLTKIRFLHYAMATFFGMLPACIAFIVFSSSLPELLRGKFTFSFLTGLGLILLVSLAPLFYRRYRVKKGGSDAL